MLIQLGELNHFKFKHKMIYVEKCPSPAIRMKTDKGPCANAEN